MSNKPHQRPHPEERHAGPVTRLLVALLVVAFVALLVTLEVTGHVALVGR